MPEYGYSTPYRGMSGGPLPPGALEAMTAPGRNIGRGIEQLGAGVSQMIQRYQQTKAEKELASGEFEGLIAQYIPQAKDLPSGETGGVDMGFLGKIVGEKNVKKFVEGKASTADILAMTHSIKTAQAEKDKALARQLEGLQIDQIKQNLANQQREQASRDAFTKTMAFAGNIPDTVSKEVQTTEMVPQGSQQLRNVVSGYMDKARATVPALNAAVMKASQQGGWPTELQANAPAMANAAQALTAMPKTQALPMAPVTTTSTVDTPARYEDQRKALADYALSIGAAPETFAALDQMLQLAGKRQPVQVGVQQLPGNLGTVVTAGGKTEIVKPDPSVAARVIPGYSGVVPTEKEAIEFRQLQADAADASGLADELLQLSKVPFSTVDTAMRTRGQSLAQQLVGKMRLAVLGPGPINENERKILENLAANPATIFSLDVNTKSALNTLKQTLSKSIESKAKSLGLQGSGGGLQSGQPQLPRVIFNPALAK